MAHSCRCISLEVPADDGQRSNPPQADVVGSSVGYWQTENFLSSYKKLLYQLSVFVLDIGIQAQG